MELPTDEEAAVIRHKGSLAFVQTLDRCLQSVSDALLPAQDVAIGPSILCPRAQLLEWYEESAPMPFAARWRFMADRMVDWARARAELLARDLQASGALLKEAVETTFPRGPRRGQQLDELDALTGALRTNLVQAVTEYVHEYTTRWRAWDVTAIYLWLAKKGSHMSRFSDLPPDEIARFCEANAALDGQTWDESDLGPLLYLHTRIHGVPDELRWSHVVVDEGQDWSPINYAVIRHWVRDESVTVVGDLAQGISGPYGLGEWEELRGAVFGPERLQVREIKRSYRLTKQTMALAGRALQAVGLGLSADLQAIRAGAPPLVRSFAKNEEKQAAVARYIRENAQPGRSVAVLVPTAEWAPRWVERLAAAGITATLVDDQADFDGGIVVLPVHLAKGLEFDYVVVAEAGTRQYPLTPDAAKRLYVAITRAKQHVMVAAMGGLTPLLQG